MKPATTIRLSVVLSLLGLAACGKDNTSPAALVDDAQITTDVAQAAGEAIALDITSLLNNEVVSALPSAPIGFDLSGGRGADSLTTSRTKTCYDAGHVVVANCAPATTRTIVFHVTVDGSRAGTNFTGVVHRVRDWTLTRNFTTALPPAEVSRTHDGVGSSADTTTHTGALVTRTHAESAVDSTIGVTWNLPRSTNPFPVSGMIVRRVSVHSTFQSGTRQETRDVVRRVEVDFPADAQGNVVMKVNEKTCNLNLVTRSVTDCH